MEQEALWAKLIELIQDIKQSGGKIGEEMSEFLDKGMMQIELVWIRDSSLIKLHRRKGDPPDLSKACDKACQEIENLGQKYLDELSEVSAAKFNKSLPNFKKDKNNIARSYEIKEIWGEPKD